MRHWRHVESRRLPGLRRPPRPAVLRSDCRGSAPRSRVGWSTSVAAQAISPSRLAQRWPDAVIEAWDSSPEMVESARERGVDAHVGDVRTWAPQARHRRGGEQCDAAVGARARRAAGALGGRAAAGFVDRDAGARQLRRTVASRPSASSRAASRWSEPLQDIPFRERVRSSPAAGYAELLTDAGCTVDAWETDYIHELTGEHPVLEWITGTALRPVRSGSPTRSGSSSARS